MKSAGVSLPQVPRKVYEDFLKFTFMLVFGVSREGVKLRATTFIAEKILHGNVIRAALNFKHH